MFRKTMALVIGLSMILSMSLVAFSLDEQSNFITNAELESSFEIIEPKVKLKKELYIRDNLLVSISLSEEFENFQIPVEMNLYSVEEFVELSNGRITDESSLDDQVSLDDVVFRNSIDVNVSGLSSEKVSELYNDLDAYKMYLSDVLKLTREDMVKLNSVDISSVRVIKKELVEEFKTDIVEIEKVAVDEVMDTETDTIISDEEKLAELKKMAELEKEKSATLVLLYEKVLLELDLVESELEEIEKVYNSLFERQISESILVEKSGLLPYFKYTYEELDAGQYRLEFIRNDNEVIVKTVDFSINRKEQLTEEKIKENITESLDILYNDN